jgi:hypothetical protein
VVCSASSRNQASLPDAFWTSPTSYRWSSENRTARHWGRERRETPHGRPAGDAGPCCRRAQGRPLLARPGEPPLAGTHQERGAAEGLVARRTPARSARERQPDHSGGRALRLSQVRSAPLPRSQERRARPGSTRRLVRPGAAARAPSCFVSAGTAACPKTATGSKSAAWRQQSGWADDVR